MLIDQGTGMQPASILNSLAGGAAPVGRGGPQAHRGGRLRERSEDGGSGTLPAQWGEKPRSGYLLCPPAGGLDNREGEPACPGEPRRGALAVRPLGCFSPFSTENRPPTTG